MPLCSAEEAVPWPSSCGRSGARSVTVALSAGSFSLPLLSSPAASRNRAVGCLTVRQLLATAAVVAGSFSLPLLSSPAASRPTIARDWGLHTTMH